LVWVGIAKTGDYCGPMAIILTVKLGDHYAVLGLLM
jgi:hypothetical protein